MRQLQQTGPVPDRRQRGIPVVMVLKTGELKKGKTNEKNIVSADDALVRARGSGVYDRPQDPVGEAIFRWPTYAEAEDVFSRKLTIMQPKDA